MNISRNFKLTASLIVLGLGWSATSYAGAPPLPDITTLSPVKVKTKMVEQTGDGTTKTIKMGNNEVICNMAPGCTDGKPPKNYALAMLNDCDDPYAYQLLAVVDKDTGDPIEGSTTACMYQESPAVIDAKKDKAAVAYDSDCDPLTMDECDLTAELKMGKLPKKVDEAQSVCLSKFKTLTMSGYWSEGPDGATGNMVMDGKSSIKTTGKPKLAIEPGGIVAAECD
jgi:hypothetical protein